MKLSIIKRIIFSFVLALVILLVVGSISYYKLLQLKQDILLQHNAFIEDQRLDDVLSSLKDAQRAERGFLLTADEKYLTPFNNTRDNISEILFRLKSDYKNYPLGEDSIFEIESLAYKSIERYLNIINDFKKNGLESSVKLIRLGDGNKYMEEITGKIELIREHESRLLNLRLSNINSSLHLVYLTILIGFILGAVVSGFSVYALKQNLTKRIRMETELKEAKDAAERSDKLKTEFLAQVSHEIRTPINSILSFTSYLRSELKNTNIEDINDIFEIIHNAGNRITRTIDMILNMSELQTGTYKPILKKVDLFENVVKNISASFKQQAESKGLLFEIENKAENSFIHGDEYTLNQIFDNLINNAFKYTPGGRIKVTIHKNGSNKLYADISDTGIGISQEFLNKLFEPFSQEEHGYTRRFEGNGLGLALVKKYCEINNADISVKSKKGAGSTFTLIFNQ